MTKVTLFAVLFLFCNCTQSIKKQAKSAAHDYCNCIKDNIFSYKIAQDLYIHCNTILYNKYRLIRIRLNSMGDSKYFDSLPEKQRIMYGNLTNILLDMQIRACLFGKTLQAGGFNLLAFIRLNWRPLVLSH